jgi:SNF2 family DNA or RNA helicase
MAKRYQPRPYQVESIQHVIDNPFAGLFLPPGLGKTSSTLSAMTQLMAKGEIDRIFIVAPIRVMYLVWPAEIKKWSQFQHLEHTIIHGPDKKRALKSDAEVMLINPEGLAFLYHELQHKNFSFRGSKWALVVDESTYFKNPKSQRFKQLKQMLRAFSRRLILTGTPAPNGLLQVWSQTFLLDQGERLGTSFYGYRTRYFEPSDYMGYKYEPKDWAETAIYGKLSDIIVHKSNDELDLPPKTNSFISIELENKARTLYKQLKKDMWLEYSGVVLTGANSAVIINKLKQIANGAIYDEEGEAVDIHNQKIEACVEITESLAGQPCMIFYEYRHDLAKLKKAYPKAKVVGSGVKGPELQQIVDDWNSNRIPVLLLHPQSAGHGLNLQESRCHDIIWYSLPHDLELYIQAVARVHRSGVKNPVTVHHLVAKGTVDEVIVESWTRKGSLQSRLLESLRI